MEGFRNNPPKELGGSKLAIVKDYFDLTEKNLIDGTSKQINQKITSDVLQFFTEDGSKVSVRPSGTEPKIKFYFEVKSDLRNASEFDDANSKAEEKINLMMQQLVK